MRALSILCLSVVCACAGPQRPVGDPSVTHVSSTLADTQGDLIWRFSFDVSKTWSPKLPAEAQRFALNNESGDAMLFLQFRPIGAGETALSVAHDLLGLSSIVLRGDATLASEIEINGTEQEATFSFIGKSDGVAMAIQCRVHGVASGGHKTWMVLMGMSAPSKERVVALDMRRAAGTAVLEPIEW